MQTGRWAAGNEMDDYSSFLFARPSFSEGVGRVLDFGNTLTEYNSSLDVEQADRIALLSDWRSVGSDIADALRQRITDARRGEKEEEKEPA